MQHIVCGRDVECQLLRKNSEPSAVYVIHPIHPSRKFV